MSKKKFLVIVDPWLVPSPEMAKEFPMLASDSNIQCQLIYNQLSRLKLLFDDIIVDDSGYPSHPLFDELPRVRLSWSNEGLLESEQYLQDKQDWDMWLCGFHYGRCIHGKIIDVIKEHGWDYSRFHIIQNLSWFFPRDLPYYDWYPKLKEELPWNCDIEIIQNIKEYHWNYVEKLIEL